MNISVGRQHAEAGDETPVSGRDALDVLINRRSLIPQRMTDRPVTDADLDIALRAASTAPDHGFVRPYRFRVLRGADRQWLSDLLVACLKKRDPEVPEAKLERTRNKPLQAGAVIVASAALQPDHPKAPEMEQIITAGIAAQNVMAALFALGYGGIWLTGGDAYDPEVAKAFDLQVHERLIGFLYVGGMPESGTKGAPRPAPETFARFGRPA